MTIVESWNVPHVAEISPGFQVRRSLPFKGGRGVGPFVFLDQMGPHEFKVGEFSDVGSHPHIGLATVTYLFDGAIEHRDSLNTIQLIRPGDVNWMVAGRGIVHAEKTPPESKQRTRTLSGIQAWVALPREHEDCEASFAHHGKDELPVYRHEGIEMRLIAGEAFGLRSPVQIHSRLFYLHGECSNDSLLVFDSQGQECAVYVMKGELSVEEKTYSGPGLLVFNKGAVMRAEIKGGTTFLMLGGETLPERRSIWWNFVSTSREKIETAKQLWIEQKLGKVPGETEWVPLPGSQEVSRATPQQILDFWLRETESKYWFEKNPEFDEKIRRRFGDTHRLASAGGLSHWRQSAEGALAEIIVLDQFSRNLFRDSPEAFAGDALALSLAKAAIEKGVDRNLSLPEKSFLYMPFMHSENITDHEVAVKLFSQKSMENNYKFELMHKKIIERFGRYPHRNQALGRVSTPEEQEFLKEEGSSF